MIGPLLKQEIENAFTVVRDRCTPDELVILCVECGDKTGNRGINLKTGLTHCWRCNKGQSNRGYFLAWARALGYRFAADDGSSVPVEQLLYRADEEVSSVPLVKEVELPRGFTPILRKPKSVYTELIIQMAERKNLLFEDFVEANVGFTMDDPYWEAYAIFPVYEYGMPVYYQGRTYTDVPGETTKRFPSRSHVKWGAGYWVYNIDAVRQEKPEVVVVVESILNVLSLRWKLQELGCKTMVPVCVFKHHVSKVQALKLIHCAGLKEICLLFDHDAIDATWRSVGYLGNRMRMTVAEMPMLDGNRKCDPNDNVEAAIRAIGDRKLYTVASASSRLLETSWNDQIRQQVSLAGRKIGS